MITCHRLRGAVLLSALLLMGGLGMEWVGPWFAFPAAIMALALFSGLAAVAILAITLIIALWPGSTQRLANCRH